MSAWLTLARVLFGVGIILSLIAVVKSNATTNDGDIYVIAAVVCGGLGCLTYAIEDKP